MIDLTPSVQSSTGALSLAPLVPTLPAAAGGSFIGLDGASINGTSTGITAHTWVDNAQGLFETTTDLSAEWAGYYQQMIEGHSASLTPPERLEGQAQALFLFTGLGTLSAAQQSVVRQDVAREIDVIGAAMTIDETTLGIDPTAPLTAQTYLDLDQTILANPQLRELGIQGHGLNDPPLARYDGYTVDAQHTADNRTLYLGYGADHGEKAVTNFMDDAIMTHLVFPVVMRNGVLVQLNQNGAREETLVNAVRAIDRTMFGAVLTAKDFSKPPKA